MADPVKQEPALPSGSPVEALLSRVARRDRAAFAELYKETSAKLFGIALRITGRRELAEEALQESFVAVWERAGVYDPAHGSATAWLATIVRHRAIDQRRRATARGERRVAPEEPLPGLAASHRSASRAELRALERCLDELEPAPRRAVLLAYRYGLSRDEVAARLEASLGTVKSWLRRSPERLQRCLEG